MIGVSVRLAYRGRHAGKAVAGGAFAVLFAAVLVGLIGMHGLTSPAVPLSAMAVGHDAGSAQTPAHHGDDAPDPRHSTHVGPVCQSAALNSGHQGPVLSPAVDAAPVRHADALPVTTSGSGSVAGCGPPSVYELSILRL